MLLSLWGRLVADIIQFPPQEPTGPICVICKQAIVLTKDERDAGVVREKCFCCLRTIPLPLSVPAEPCPECAGDGRIAVHVCRDKRECEKFCLKLEPCIACGGTGRKK